MRLEAHFLRSKVARRIFLLFLFCAMLPIVVLTIVSSGFVTQRLSEQANERLRRTSKMIAMEIAGNIARVDSELKMAVLVAESVPDVFASDRWKQMRARLAGRVDRFDLVPAAEIEPELPGRSAPDPRAVPDEHGSAAPGNPSTLLVDTRDGVARVRLVTALDERNLERGYVVAEIDTEQLWSQELSPGTQMLVLDHQGTVLYSSADSEVSLPKATLREITRSTRGDFEWRQGEQDYLAHHWMLYLKPQYDYPSWTVVFGESKDQTVATLRTIGRSLPVVIALCLMVVVLFSSIMIRKSLVPIVDLQEGTRRIAESRFDTRVTVNTDDEFQQLAQSFNTMAARLGSQFDKLTAVAEIDRAILSTLELEQIVSTLLSRLPDHLPCDAAALTVVDPERDDTLRVCARWITGPTAQINESVVLPPTERIFLARLDDWIRLPQCEMPRHLVAVFPEDISGCLVLPFRRKGIRGYLAIGDVRDRDRSQEDYTEARRLTDQVAVALANASLLSRLEQANWETLQALARAVDANSPWTAGHSERVTAMALQLGRRLDLSQDELITLHKGGLLHDIGKIGVPNHILDKPGRLTDEEFAAMRAHTTIGARILEPISAYRGEIPIVLYHHERYDGGGYPEGLAGEEIPFHARILSVADVYDALISERPYRKSWSQERVVRFIGDGAGTQFDPQVVSAFTALMQPTVKKDEESTEECQMVTA